MVLLGKKMWNDEEKSNFIQETSMFCNLKPDNKFNHYYNNKISYNKLPYIVLELNNKFNHHY